MKPYHFSKHNGYGNIDLQAFVINVCTARVAIATVTRDGVVIDRIIVLVFPNHYLNLSLMGNILMLTRPIFKDLPGYARLLGAISCICSMGLEADAIKTNTSPP